MPIDPACSMHTISQLGSCLMRIAFLGLLLLAPATAGAAERVSYGRDVRPILSENCFYCHGQDPNRRPANLRLDTAEGRRAEGIVAPGQPDESELVWRILSDDDTERMPPPKS